jgi:hypothetical protein
MSFVNFKPAPSTPEKYQAGRASAGAQNRYFSQVCPIRNITLSGFSKELALLTAFFCRYQNTIEKEAGQRTD